MVHSRIAVTVVVLLSVSGASCASTGEERTVFDVLAIGRGGSTPFENVPPVGVAPWTVTLERAVVAFGPVYLFEGEPLLGGIFRRALVSTAYAHPGHYQEGDALGEMLDQGVVDLLADEPQRLGTMGAVTGSVGSARLGLGTPDVALEGAGALAGHALVLGGTAERDEETIAFEAALDADLYVEGVAFEHRLALEPGSLLVEIDLQRWLRRVDFSTAASDQSGTSTFEEGSQAHNALGRGVDNTLAYTVRWVPASE